MPRLRCFDGIGASPVTPGSEIPSWPSSTRAPDRERPSMTIKWVVSDPLVMNGEPFCYGTRLTVRNILEMRESGYDLIHMIKDHPELRTMGVAAAFAYAAANRARYAEFFDAEGSLVGPGYSEEEAADLPAHLRIAG